MTIPDSRHIAVPFSFTFGQAAYFALQIELQANFSSGFGSAGYDIDYGQSLYFGGISNVSSITGGVTTFTAVGTDGLDYARSYAPVGSGSVPDHSSSVMLLALSLCGLIAASRFAPTISQLRKSRGLLANA